MAIEKKETKKTSPEQRAKQTEELLSKRVYPGLAIASVLLGAAPVAMLFAGLALFPPKIEPYKPHLLDKLGEAIAGITKPRKYI